MCGIGGLLNFSGDMQAALAAMNDALAHRGPDDAGIWHADGIGLCHRRLSIIDREGGAQPMQSADGQLIVAYNGEIYNYRELRESLRACGCVFQSASDTEVLLHGYRIWKDALVERLNGMFAFILLDRREGRVLMARDHLGIKPLYIARLGPTVAVASELNALLALPVIRDTCRLNPTALVHYMTLHYVPDPLTVYREIEALPPAHLAVYQDGGLRIRRYWRIPAPDGALRLSYPEAVEALDGLIRQSVQRQLVSDVPLGAFLSGGVDSAVVVAQMAAVSPDVRTFTVGFAGYADDERAAAQETAAWLKTRHTSLAADSATLEQADALLAHFGQPFSDSSALPTYLVSRATREHVTVALSGDGGDELFGGYLRYDVPASRRWLGLLPQSVRGPLMNALADRLPPGLRGVNWLRGAALDPVRFALLEIGEFRARELLHPDLLAAADLADTWGFIRDMAQTPPDLDTRTRMQWLDTHSYLPGDILTKVDRMSMAVSLETRVPLLDKDIVAFAFSLPPDYLLRGGRRKAILKDVLARYVPPAMIDRPKRGFSVPLSDWCRNALAQRLRETLDPARRDAGPIRRAAATRLLDEHVCGYREHPWRLWQLYVLSRWWDNARPRL